MNRERKHHMKNKKALKKKLPVACDKNLEQLFLKWFSLKTKVLIWISSGLQVVIHLFIRRLVIIVSVSLEFVWFSFFLH